MEKLDKGLLDFGVVFGTVDLTKYNALKLPDKDVWGVLIGLDKIINTSCSSLCFRPLAPKLEEEMSIIWKKHQIFSRPAEKFLSLLKEYLNGI